MRSALFCFAALALAACSTKGGDTDGGGSDGGADLGPPVRLVLATFNVRNFFDSVDDPDKLDDTPRPSDVSAKIKQLGIAIRRLAADVIALQEVENLALLERLNKEQLSTLGYDHLRLVEGSDLRGVDVALLSRFPIPRSISHKNDRFKGVDGDPTTYGFSRDCLEATIEVTPGKKLILLVNHLAAIDQTDPLPAERRRKAQAQQVRRIANETLNFEPNANIAVVGDLNDTPTSRSYELITAGKVAFADTTASAPASDRYTTVFRGQRRQIDYILAAPGLLRDLVSGSAKSPHDGVYSSTSDHFPVVATFELR